MRVDLVTLGDMLAQGDKAPDKAFPWYRPDPTDIDRAEVRCVHRDDEDAFLAGDKEEDELRVVRLTRIVSASAGTLDRHQEAQNIVSKYLRLLGQEQQRREEAFAKGEAYKERQIPEPVEYREGRLKVVIARLLAEGVESWEPAPRAVVPIPSLGIKRGDELPIPYEHVPPDPADYGKKANAVLLEIVDALPSHFAQRLMLAIAWISNLDVRRFFPSEKEAEEEKLPAPPEVGTEQGKPSDSP